MAIDASYLTDLPADEFRRFVRRMNPALRVVLERHRARLLREPDIGSFHAFIEPDL
ncbi:hypothetical protein ACIBAG_25250 [Streptomyces sp. NPDC051243]|uniref:hypothetical protein n=1 Tax=Streptomyces sp. NPDC051243 TaxID=3365646 RepID=UPI00379C38C5